MYDALATHYTMSKEREGVIHEGSYREMCCLMSRASGLRCQSPMK